MEIEILLYHHLSEALFWNCSWNLVGAFIPTLDFHSQVWQSRDGPNTILAGWSTQGARKVGAAYCILHQLGHPAIFCILQYTSRHRNILRNTTEYFNILQQPAAYGTTLGRGIKLQHTTTYFTAYLTTYGTTSHTSTHCNINQSTASCCNICQHTAAPSSMALLAEAASCWSGNPCHCFLQHTS